MQEQVDLNMKETELSISHQNFSDLPEYKQDSDMNGVSSYTVYGEITNASIVGDVNASFSIFGGGEINK